MPTITLPSTGVFTGYTLGDLRSQVLRRLRVTNTARYSPTAGTADYDWVDDAINRAQDSFVRWTKCLRGYAIVELAANQRTYRLPEDFLDLMSAYYYDSALTNGYQELTFFTIEELNDEIADWRVKTGSPTRLYLDRNYGQGQTFGLYPIPDTAGDSPVFTSDYGTAVTWVCPLYTLNQDVGVIIRITDVDEWILSAQVGVAIDVNVNDHNLVIEYYRLPQELVASGTNTDIYSEIPREFQASIINYAVADLLGNNPEDSAEFKRSQAYKAEFQNEVQTYINRRKRPLAGRNLRARSNAWGWVANMDWYKAIP